MSVAFFWIFVLLLAFGTPVVFALLLGPGLSLLLDGEMQYFPALLARFYNGIDSFPLLAVPFFILAGEIMNAGGITASIVRFAQSLVGHVRGGLAQVNVLSSMIFAGISGSAVADASAIGKMLIPSMEREGYPRPFAAAVTAAVAVVGPIIPPSGIMVLYGFVMNVSVGALFAAGVVPGILIGLGLMGTIRVLANRYQLPASKPRASWSERGAALRAAWLALLLPVILLGGMLSGVFTATEAAAVAVAYALFVTVFVLRKARRAELATIFRNTALQSGVILLLVGAAVTLGWLVTVSGMAKGIADSLLSITDNVTGLLFLVNLLLFIVGMFRCRPGHPDSRARSVAGFHRDGRRPCALRHHHVRQSDDWTRHTTDGFAAVRHRIGCARKRREYRQGAAAVSCGRSAGDLPDHLFPGAGTHAAALARTRLRSAP